MSFFPVGKKRRTPSRVKHNPMNAPENRKNVCRQCSAVLRPDDRFCSVCGAPTRGVIGASPTCEMGPTSDPAAGRTRLIDNPWFILALLFLVLGPLALPLLWRSRGFSLLWKSLLTAVVVLFTVLLVFEAWSLVIQSRAYFDEVLKMEKGF
jgi:hypothetical protein